MEQNNQLEDIIEDVTVEELAEGLELEQESTIVSEEQVVETEEVTLEEATAEEEEETLEEEADKGRTITVRDLMTEYDKDDEGWKAYEAKVKKLGVTAKHDGVDAFSLTGPWNKVRSETIKHYDDADEAEEMHSEIKKSKNESIEEYVSPQQTKSEKLAHIKVARKQLEDKIAKIRKDQSAGEDSRGPRGDSLRIIDMHNADLKKLDAREKKIMKMTESYQADLAALTESEANLTESFKEKAAIIFEAAVTSKVREEKEKLAEQFETQLSEQTSQLRADLEEKVDNYLTYVVESWVEDNKVAIESGLRSEIAENFIGALKTVFVENYIEVPESKKDLVSDLEIELAAIKESAIQAEAEAAVLNERVEELVREKIISEAGLSLADTQAAKLANLVQDVEFVSEDTFRNKVETIKEAYFSNKDNVKALEESSDSTYETIETIVEGEDFSNEISPSMAKYLTAVSRLANAKG